MEHRQLKKRQGVSLKKSQAFNLTKNIEKCFQKDQERFVTSSSNQFSRFQNQSSKYQALRPNTTRNNKHESNLQIDKNSHQKNRNRGEKMCKLSRPQLNSPGCHYEYNIKTLVDQISPKAKCFYRFGLKSYSHQKPSHKRVFSEMMNVPLQGLKGVMHIGELWSNQMSTEFVKLNKMSMKEDKFFQKLKKLRLNRIRKERQKQLDSSNLISSVKEFSQRSLKSLPMTSHFQSLLSLKYFKQDQENQNVNLPIEKETQRAIRLQLYERNSKQFKKIMSTLRNTIESEQVRCKNENYWREMKGLESESKEMHKIWNSYFGKMLEIR